MARKTKEEAEATREAILEAASKVFADEGVAQASLEKIAAEAGVTRGAVYWHFKNKPDIFRALYDQLYTPFLEMLLADLERNHPQPLDQLAKLFTDLFVDLAVNPKKSRALTIFFLKCDYSGEMAEVRQGQIERKAKSIALFAEYFKRAQAKGHLPPDADPHILTLVLTSFITGLTYEYLRCPELFDLPENAARLVDSFFKGLARRGG